MRNEKAAPWYQWVSHAASIDAGERHQTAVGLSFAKGGRRGIKHPKTGKGGRCSIEQVIHDYAEGAEGDFWIESVWTKVA